MTLRPRPVTDHVATLIDEQRHRQGLTVHRQRPDAAMAARRLTSAALGSVSTPAGNARTFTAAGRRDPAARPYEAGDTRCLIRF